MPDATRSRPLDSAESRRAATAFVLSAAALSLLALRGGSYDIVARQEAGIVAWWLLALGFGLGLLPRARPHPLVELPLLALVALAVWTALSLGWTDSDERTLAEVARLVGYLGLLVLVLSVVDRRTWRAAAAGLAAGALLIAAVAVASRLAPGLFPEDPVRAFLPDRLSYPLDYWNAVGAWGAMAIVGAVGWSVGVARPALRAAWLAAIPTAALCVYLTYSRAAVIGVAVGVLCVLALSRRRLLAAAHVLAAGVAGAIVILVVRGEPSLARGVDTAGTGPVLLALVLCSAACAGAALALARAGVERGPRLPRLAARLALALVAVCLLGVGVVAGTGAADRAWTSFRSAEAQPAAPEDPSERLGSLRGSGRYAFWAAALDTFRADPAKGTGAGTFEFAWNRSDRAPDFIRDAHSLYVEPLAELGWPGCLLTLVFLAAVGAVSIAALGRSQRATTHGGALALLAVFAVFLVQAGMDWLWESTAVTVLALAGAAIAWTRLSDPGPPPVLSLPTRVVGAIVCLLACLLLLPGLVSTSLVRKSQDAVRGGDLQGAEGYARDAVGAAPWAATPRLQRGLVSEAAGDLRAARADIREALAREPRNWRLPLALARVEAELGHPAAAVRQFRRARRLRPQAAIFRSAR